MPRKGGREKDLEANVASSVPPAFPSPASDKTAFIGSSSMGPRPQLSSEQAPIAINERVLALARESATFKSVLNANVSFPSTASSVVSEGNKVFDAPVSPGHADTPSTSEKKPARKSSVSGDVNIIASARVLLQLAPHKTEPSDLVSGVSGLPRTPSTSSGAPNEDNSPGCLLQSRGSIGFLPRSLLGNLGIIRPDVPISHGSLSSDKILQAAKILEHLCNMVDLNVSIAEMFLLGYSTISKDPVILRSKSPCQESDYLYNYLHEAPFTDFDIGVGYTITAIGAINMSAGSGEASNVAKELANKAWTFFLEYLLPLYTLVENQLEALKNMYLLAHTYLKYFGKDLMIDKLDEATSSIMEKFTGMQEPRAKELLQPYMEIIWNIYILVSKHKVDLPTSRFFGWLSTQTIDANLLLSHYMLALPKEAFPSDDLFLAEIIACTFSNEVNNLNYRNTLAIYSSKVELHAALLLGLESLVNNTTHDTKSYDIFNLLQTKVLKGCPDLMQTYLKQHICKISAPFQWQFFILALRVADFGGATQSFVRDNKQGQFDIFGKSLINYLDYATAQDLRKTKNMSDMYVSSLSILSFSMVFNSKMLHMKSYAAAFDLNCISDMEANTLATLVLEWYLSVIKTLILMLNLLSNDDLEKAISESLFVQGLLYVTESHSFQPQTKPTEIIYHLYKKLSAVCDLWLGLNTSQFVELRANLDRFLNDLFTLASTSDNFSVRRVFVSNGTISLLERTEVLPDPKERRSMSLCLPLTLAQADISNANGNYVLIKPKGLLPQLNFPSGEKAPGAVFPPLFGVSGLPMPETPHPQRQSILGLLDLSFLTVKSPPFFLPPLQHPIKSEPVDGPLIR